MIIQDELLHPNTPQPVRAWATHPPPWLTVATAPAHDKQALQQLDPGESAAIALALALPTDLMLMDDRAPWRSPAHQDLRSSARSASSTLQAAAG